MHFYGIGFGTGVKAISATSAPGTAVHSVAVTAHIQIFSEGENLDRTGNHATGTGLALNIVNHRIWFIVIHRNPHFPHNDPEQMPYS